MTDRSKDLFTLINERMHSLSKGHKLIANYILSHYDKAAFMTAQKLGRTVGVSESTTVRFAAELGFEGYPELQKALKDLVRNKLTSVQRMEATSEVIDSDNVLERVLSLDIERIRRTMEETSVEDFNSAVDKIVSADTIYIVGTRSAASIASFLSYYLGLLFPRVKLVVSATSSELFERIMRIDEKDAMIGISFPRYSKQTVQALRYAKDNGAKVIAITDSQNAPIARYADSLLIARSDMASFVDSLVAPLSLINALIVAASTRNLDASYETFERLEKVWEEYDVYEKNGEF
ncbi:MAG: MurR/RpiR family transcriptional regulator [Ruminococcus sp.]|nr:MurR/RpiR family transcriptional regulator [Ruminococcus sp.]